MAEVFISYRQDDRKRVEPIVKALRTEGFDVWWDKGVMAGAQWRRELDSQLDEAKAIVAIWSGNSITSDWVIEEAAYGKRKGRLCPARIDSVEPPIGFTTIQVADLVGWRGNRRAAAWRHFVRSLRASIDGNAPGPIESESDQGNHARFALAAAVAVALLGSAWAVTRVTGMPIYETFLGSAQQRAEWLKVKASRDCKLIRAFAASHVDSPFVGDASAAVANPVRTSELSWAPSSQTLPVTGVSVDDSGQTAACRSAKLAAERSAQENCGLFFNGIDKTRHPKVSVTNQACHCKEALGHWQCTTDTRAQCSWEIQQPIVKEVCP